ncbi:MAG: hypothetical protein H7A37_03570 [Chlamydiales bacterium]|nr:hypothetical protein [Chlamydiales bacterium]
MNFYVDVGSDVSPFCAVEKMIVFVELRIAEKNSYFAWIYNSGANWHNS